MELIQVKAEIDFDPKTAIRSPAYKVYSALGGKIISQPLNRVQESEMKKQNVKFGGDMKSVL